MRLKHGMLAFAAASVFAAAPAIAQQGGQPMGQEQAQGSGEMAEVDNETVREVQQKLRDMGHDPGPIDGLFGESTASAVRDFQEEEGLQATGELDSRTLSTLGVGEERAIGGGEAGGQAGGRSGDQLEREDQDGAGEIQRQEPDAGTQPPGSGQQQSQ